MCCAVLQGRCRANDWRGGLDLYPQLEEALRTAPVVDSVASPGGPDTSTGRRARSTLAYHWVAEAMLRDGATVALADFIVRENI